MSVTVNGNAPSASMEQDAQNLRNATEVKRDLFAQMARRDPAMALLYVNRMREQIAALQQVEAVSLLAEHTERLEWVDHLLQMLNSGEYALPKSKSAADSPDRTIAVGEMDSHQEISNLINRGKMVGKNSGDDSYFDAVEDYLNAMLPADEANGDVHDLIAQATGTDYDSDVFKFDQFKNMLQTRRSALSQDGTRLSTEHQYARANIDQIKVWMSSTIDQLYGLMTKLATFG